MTQAPANHMITGAAWREEVETGQPLYLPGENKWIAVQAPDFGLLAQQGRLMDILTPIVAQALGNLAKTTEQIAQEFHDQQVADKPLFTILKAERDLLEAFNMAVWVKPYLTHEPVGPNDLHPRYVKTATLEFVMGIFSQPAAVLEDFFREQKQHLESLVSGGDRAPVAESVRGDQPVGGEGHAHPG